jgi:hypothetical protein
MTNIRSYNMPNRAEAKNALDKVIAKSRVHFGENRG